MGKAYTDEERSSLREKIIEVAKRMFIESGYEAFRIQQLATEVGISLGGFYTFFKNKEALYQMLIREEEERIREVLLCFTKQWEKSPREYIRKIASIIKEKKKLNGLYKSDVPNHANLTSILLYGHTEQNREDNLKFINKIKEIMGEKGYLVNTSAEEILGVLSAMVVLCENREKIGEAVFDNIYFEAVNKFAEKYFN